MRFGFPLALGLVLILPFLWHLRFGLRERHLLAFPSVRLMKRVPPSWRVRWRKTPDVLRLAALTLTVIALARPQIGQGTVVESRQGIAVMIILDRSGSMAQPVSVHEKPISRWEAAKEAARLFVSSGELFKDSGDLLGLVAFTRHAETLCPPTWNHDVLLALLEEIDLEENPEADGTALGEAIALGAARLRKAEEFFSRHGTFQGPPSLREAAKAKAERASMAQGIPFSITAKVLIVFTDGRNNAGRLEPEEAGRLAAQWGVRIHTVGIADEVSRFDIPTLTGIRETPTAPGIDEAVLQSLAERTGGTYHRVRSVQGLREVLVQLKALERTSFPTTRTTRYGEAYSWFIAAALAALALETGLRSTIFRSLP